MTFVLVFNPSTPSHTSTRTRPGAPAVPLTGIAREYGILLPSVHVASDKFDNVELISRGALEGQQ